MSEPFNNMTLRQKLNEADKLARELIHHVEHGFVPRAHRLRRTAREGNDHSELSDITDLTIRNEVELTLRSDDFTRQVSDQLTQFLDAIDRDVDRILGVE